MSKNDQGSALSKSIMEKIEKIKVQLKQISDRELKKSLIPVHNHNPGSVVSGGIEDVPYGKVNPKGTAKAEKCMKCGHMHQALDKCGEMKKTAKSPILSRKATKKSELVDAKGNRSSNSENTPFPVKADGTGMKEVKAEGSGGKVVKKAEETAHDFKPMVKDPKKEKEQPWSKTCVHCGKSETHSIHTVKKAEPPMAKPPSGVNMATKVPVSKPGKAPKMGAAGLDKGILTEAAKRSDPVSAAASAHAASKEPKVKLPGASEQAQRASNFSAAGAGEFQPKGPVSSGLELDDAKRAAPKLASPKAAGVVATKPGIFGRLMGKK